MKSFKLLLEKEKPYTDFLTALYSDSNKSSLYNLNTSLSKHYKFDDMKYPHPEHYETLHHYTQNGYRNINEYLWDQHKAGNTDIEKNHDIYDLNTVEKIRHLDSALKAYKTPHPLSVWSGIKQNFKPEENKVYHHPGFLSTSIHKKISAGFVKNEDEDIDPFDNEINYHYNILHIKVPEGHHGAYIGHISDHPREKEFLLPRDTKFKHIYTHKFLKSQKDNPTINYYVHHMNIVEK